MARAFLLELLQIKNLFANPVCGALVAEVQFALVLFPTDNKYHSRPAVPPKLVCGQPQMLLIPILHLGQITQEGTMRTRIQTELFLVASLIKGPLMSGGPVAMLSPATNRRSLPIRYLEIARG